jgi:hypothetical protein
MNRETALHAKELNDAFMAKEEVQGLLENLERLSTSSQLSQQKYDLLKIDYQRRMAETVSRIAQLKNIINGHLQILKQQLNSSKTELESARAAFNIGNLSASDFRKTEERSGKTQNKLREDISILQRFVDAKTAAQGDPTLLPKPAIRVFMASRWRLALAVAVPLILIGTFAAIIFWPSPQPVALVAENNTPAAQTPPPQTSPTPSTDWPALIEKIKPSVVFIYMPGYYSYTAGSGTIVDERGYILTNYHVVTDDKDNVENKIFVYLCEKGTIAENDTRYPATVLKRDKDSDLAIIKINASGKTLQSIELGDSSALKQTEEIVAIGYPNFRWGSPSVTKGIVSALRNEDGINYIQTDAAFNKGNSGGLLINRSGQMVGIPTFIVKESEGMGYAVAVESAKPFIESAIGK